jgi:cytochrome c553
MKGAVSCLNPNKSWFMAIYMHRLNTKITWSVVIAFGALAAATSCSAEPNVLAGKAFAQANCSHCHSIDKDLLNLSIVNPVAGTREQAVATCMEEINNRIERI